MFSLGNRVTRLRHLNRILLIFSLFSWNEIAFSAAPNLEKKPIAKPATIPVTKPVPKPVAKPTTIPIANPAIKPAAIPVTKPTANPVAKAVATSKRGTTFEIEWNYEEFPLQIEMYDIRNPNLAGRSTMGRLNSKVNTILANKIKDTRLFVPDRDLYRFALVVENTTEKQVYFHVVPHEITPAEYSLGTRFNCLCKGHIFSVAPHEIWYRIVSLGNSTPQLGTEFKIRHKVIGLDVQKTFHDAKESQDSNE